MFTAVLAVILIYLFSIVGYIFFQGDFLMEVDRIKGKCCWIPIALTHYQTTKFLTGPNWNKSQMTFKSAFQMEEKVQEFLFFFTMFSTTIYIYSKDKETQGVL